MMGCILSNQIFQNNNKKYEEDILSNQIFQNNNKKYEEEILMLNQNIKLKRQIHSVIENQKKYVILKDLNNGKQILCSFSYKNNILIDKLKTMLILNLNLDQTNYLINIYDCMKK